MDTSLKLQLITLFDSICFGLVYCFFNPHLLVLGGDHVTIGAFAVLYLLCQLVSNDIMNIFIKKFGQKLSLQLSLLNSILSHLLIASTGSCLVMIFARCAFALTNFTNTIAKSILLHNIPKDETNNYLIMHNFLSSVGYVVGPVISGCLFPLGFQYTSFIVTVLSFAKLLLACGLKEPPEVPAAPENKPLIEKYLRKVLDSLITFLDCYASNWDLISLKFFFVTSMTIFFSKFTQILSYNLGSSSEAIGFVTAYMNSLIFASTYIVDNTRDKQQDLTLKLIHTALVVLLICLTIACYSPSYIYYLLMCFPISLCQCYLNTAWGKLFSARKNESVKKFQGDIGVIAGLTVPIAFGVTCNSIQHNAVILYSIAPIIASLYIFRMYTMDALELVEDDIKEE